MIGLYRHSNRVCFPVDSMCSFKNTLRVVYVDCSGSTSRTGKGKGVGGGTKRCDSVKVHLTLFPLGDVLDSKSNLTHLVL